MGRRNPNTLRLGDWNAICDVCGWKYKASDLRRRWDNLMVCAKDWEPRHPQDFIRAIPDMQAVPWTRPESANVFGAELCATVESVCEYAIAECAICDMDGAWFSEDDLPAPPGTCGFTEAGCSIAAPGTITIDDPLEGFLAASSIDCTFTVSGGPGVNYVRAYFNGSLVATYDNTLLGTTDFSDTIYNIDLSAHNDCTPHSLALIVEDILADISVTASITGTVCY